MDADSIAPELPDGGLLTVMFLNLDMKRVRTGIENAALLRARLFEQHLGIVPQILTVKYDAHFAETQEALCRAGFVTTNAIFRNLYDHFQFANRDDVDSRPDRHEEPAADDNWRVVPVAGVADTRVFDARNQLLMYRKCSRQTGVLEYINYFQHHKIWRRDSFTSRGWLSRIQFVDTASGDATHEHFLRPDGSVALIQWYTRDGGQQQLAKIQLLNRRGFCVQEFGHQAELIAFWLRSITSEAERRYVMIVDKNRVFAEPLLALKSSPEYQNNVVVIPVIHAVHTKDAFDIKHSRTNGNYANILENLKSSDAVIVATEKQKRDITARYGQGNIHSIPHPYEATGQPTGFEDRQRYTVVYLGRYSAEKNQAMAIRAFAQVVRVVPQAKLQLYGHGSGKRALQEQVKQLGLEQSISINDFVQDVAAVYESAGLSILTSQGEGFSLVVLESLCHGCPVVAFDVNYGPADMIEDGENGALVPFGNEDLLAQRIIEILGDPERHQRQCDHARGSAKQFRTVVVAEKWKSLIEDVLQPSAKTQVALNIGPALRSDTQNATISRDGSGASETFDRYFSENKWGNAETVSGGGSTLVQTQTLRTMLPTLFSNLRVRSLLDLPCGDFHWMRHVPLDDGVQYVGADLVEALVQRNQDQFGSERLTFIRLDLLCDRIPCVDLILCRDCLVHLPNADIRSALVNLCRSGSQWLLTTTFPGHHSAKDIAMGKWRPLNLEAEPFCLPPPLRLLVERCTQGNGRFADKSLGLWHLQDIANALGHVPN